MTPSQNPDDEKAKRVPYHFGEKLRQVREHKGYTLKVVAQILMRPSLRASKPISAI